MARRKKQVKGLKRAFLTAAAVVAGSTSAAGCRPVVCDPAPPPSTAPRPTPDTTLTPMICDPPPPPATVPPPTATSTVTPTVTATLPPVIPIKTPMICDPAPAPPVAPGALLTPRITRHFRAQAIEVTGDPAVQGALVRGQVLDVQGLPLVLVTVVASGEGIQVEAATDASGNYELRLSRPGAYVVAVGGDQASAVTLTLASQQVATVAWREIVPAARLPLAEIREVEIAWQGGLEFLARSPWPGARCIWSVSGGTLAEAGEAVTWQPPAEAGRYLLQVAADWGADGLAVAATVLTIEDSGRIVVG